MRSLPFLLLAGLVLALITGVEADEGPETEMELAGSYGTPDRAMGVTVSGNYAYVAAGYSGLMVMDVSDPTNPTRVGVVHVWDENSIAYADDVVVSGNYAYVAAGYGGLWVLDVSDPTNPTTVGFYDTSGYAKGVAVSGYYAYVADYYGGLVVVDVRNLSNPARVGSYEAISGNGTMNASGIYVDDVVVSGGYTYIIAGYSGLLKMNMSDPTNPTLVWRYDTSDYAKGVAVSGYYAYIAYHEDGLGVVNMSNPAEPTYAGYSRGDNAYAVSVAVSGNCAYVAYHDEGLVVVDVSDPRNPTYAGSWTHGSDGAQDVAVVGGYAYVAYGYDGLMVVVVGPDSDGDAFVNAIDAFPHDPEEWADSDGDGVGDNGDPMPSIGIITAWWQVGSILLVLIASGVASIYGYQQHTFARRVSNKKDELKSKIAELQKKGVNTIELERILEKSEK